MKRCKILRLSPTDIASLILGVTRYDGKDAPPLPEGTTVMDAEVVEDGEMSVKLHNPAWAPIPEGGYYPDFDGR